jgi:murein DD-endopeptidase MepM/ murein hydrolase activator NlpD
MQRNASARPRWDPRILLVVVMLFLSSLACEAGGREVPPDDPVIRPPVAQIGKSMDEFLKFIGGLPADEVPHAWITDPISPYKTNAAELTLSGFAVNASDMAKTKVSNPSGGPPRVILYLVGGMKMPLPVVRELGSIEVGDSRQWSMPNVPLAGGENIVTVRVAAGDAKSGWSNLVYVWKGDLQLTIDSPADGTTFPIGTRTMTIAGTGPSGSEITVYRRSDTPAVPGSSRKNLGKATADAAGHWQIPSLPLLPGKGYLYASITAGQGTGFESASVEVSRPALMWPVVEPAKHRTITQWYRTEHRGLDVAFGKETPQIRAVAAGDVTKVIYCLPTTVDPTVTPTPCAAPYWNYKVDKVSDCRTWTGTSNPIYCGYGLCVIITHHGDWEGYRTLYAHLSAYDKDLGAQVEEGKPIGTGDSTGCSTGNHLHFEVQRLEDGKWQKVNLNPGRRIAGKFCRVDSPPGEDLLDFDWDTCIVALMGLPDQGCVAP